MMFRIFDPMSFFYCFSISTLAKVFICKAVYHLIFVYLYKKLLKTFCAKSFIHTCHITKLVLVSISFNLILIYQFFKCYFIMILNSSSDSIKSLITLQVTFKISNHNHQLLYMAIFLILISPYWNVNAEREQELLSAQNVQYLIR